MKIFTRVSCDDDVCVFNCTWVFSYSAVRNIGKKMVASLICC